MIVVATSNANQCQYCVVAHGAILRIRAKNPQIADQVAINYREADFAALHAHGFTDEDAWDIAGIAAFFGLSNRMANVTGMRPNAEFYALGRCRRTLFSSWRDAEPPPSGDSPLAGGELVAGVICSPPF